MLARGVQSAIYSPNEARKMEGLDSVPYGDEPRVQAQVVGLSAVGAIPTAPVPPAAPAAPAAVRNYQAAVQLDLEALTARAKRTEHPVASNGAAGPGVVRKTKTNGLQRPTV